MICSCTNLYVIPPFKIALSNIRILIFPSVLQNILILKRWKLGVNHFDIAGQENLSLLKGLEHPSLSKHEK